MKTSMKVPFLDLKAQHEAVGVEISNKMQQVVDSTAFSSGPFVAQFEEEFSSYCGCRYAVGVKISEHFISINNIFNFFSLLFF